MMPATALDPVRPPDGAKLKRLIFTSRATRPMGPMALDDLVAACRPRNDGVAVTGLLLHHQGRFLQCFEGPPATVQALYDRIRQDSRHYDVRMRLAESIADRSFGSWYLAYTNVGASAWTMLDHVDWAPSDAAAPGLSRGFLLLEQVWDLYRNTQGADRGPPGH